MTILAFNQETAISLYESTDEFPVDFEQAWQWLGYNNKQAAKKKLVRNFKKGIDYLSEWIINAHQGRSTASRSEKLKLSIDCFLLFAIATNTPKSKEIRSLFVSALKERIYIDKDDSPFVKKHENNTQDNDDSGFVYLAKMSNSKQKWYKIGCSKYPHRRMSSLQIGTPLEIVLMHRCFSFDMFALESALHDYYKDTRIRGEWFALLDKHVTEFPSIAAFLDSGLDQKYLTRQEPDGIH